MKITINPDGTENLGGTLEEIIEYIEKKKQKAIPSQEESVIIKQGTEKKLIKG